MSVDAVSRSTPFDLMCKHQQAYIYLLKGHGVSEDKHCNHRYFPPEKINLETSIPKYLTKDMTMLRQVHLMSLETIDDIRGYARCQIPWPNPEKIPERLLSNPFITGAFVGGSLGENITTKDFDLEDLPIGTRLHFKNRNPKISAPSSIPKEKGVVIRITGYRYMEGRLEYLLGDLVEPFLTRDENRNVVQRRQIGLFGVIERTGHIWPGQTIRIMGEKEKLDDETMEEEEERKRKKKEEEEKEKRKEEEAQREDEDELSFFTFL